MIEVPRKFSRPQVKNEYNPLVQCEDVAEGFFLYKPLEKTVYRAKEWEPGVRTDILIYLDKIYAK